MTKKEQRQFISELIQNVRRNMLLKVKLLPDTWDGHELRQLVADTFQGCSWTLREKHNRKRYQDYKNEVLRKRLTD